jgi:glutathione peroxidase
MFVATIKQSPMIKVIIISAVAISVTGILFYSCVRKVKSNTSDLASPVSFYSLKTEINDGTQLNFESLKGKKVLIVNTASECGFTGQYDELEKLHQQYKDKLVIIGFPANNFGGQEPGSDEEIQTFCKKNYGVTFLLAAKSSVKSGKDQNPVYTWLSSKELNGWNSAAPAWNFAKYLIDENGKLLNMFPSAVKPLDEKITSLLK